MTPTPLSPLGSVLAAAGRQPGDYSGKIDVKLTPEMPARRAMQAVLLQLLNTLEADVPGTVRDTDTEFLHDLRVAVRRSRSAVRLCGDVLAAGVPEAFRGEFKWLGDVTAPSRGLDVYLLGYGDMAGRLLSATPADSPPTQLQPITIMTFRLSKEPRGQHYDHKWGGWGSNPRPADYESAALTG